jgi:hypothetical protein
MHGCISLKIHTEHSVHRDCIYAFLHTYITCTKFYHQELMGDGSLSEEAMIELMKQQLGKQSH